MSEHDANRALLDTARLRIVDDPLEQTQRMPVADRRRRQAEAREQMLDAAVADDVHRYRRRVPGHEKPPGLLDIAKVTWPVCESIRQRARALDYFAQQDGYSSHSEQIKSECVSLELKPIDPACRIYPDFRDGRCMHGEGRYSCPICIVQDGRV